MKLKDKIIQMYYRVFEQQLRVLPANLAYSFTFAIVPILTLVIYFLTSFDLSTTVIQEFIVETFPTSVVEIFTPIFNSSMNTSSVITLFIGIFVAASGCNAIIIASNTIYDIENSPLLKRMTKALFLSIMIIVLFSFILIVPLLGRTIINLLAILIPAINNYMDIVNTIYFILRVPVSLLIIFVIIKLIYVIAPDDKIPGKYVNKGAALTTIGWFLATMIYAYYINNIARYDLVYGALANIVMLLFYFYILSFIFVIGLCMNQDNTEKAIERTTNIKLEEIRKKIKEDKK